MSKGFDGAYDQRVAVFGEEPDAALRKLIDRRGISGRALDLGAGDGRNSIFMARRGFVVDAVDISGSAVESLRQIADRENLAIEVARGDISRAVSAIEQYDLIVADTVLCHLEYEQALDTAARITGALKPGGWLYATVFHEDDPRESEFAPLVATYFTRGSICRLFRTLVIEDCERVRVVDQRHKDAHTHVMVHVIARKGRKVDEPERQDSTDYRSDR